MDAEDVIAVELGARAARLRAIVGSAFVVAGLAVGAIGYATLRSFFLERVGMSSPIAVGTLTWLPALLVAFAVGRPAAARAVASRRARWVEDLALRHGVARHRVQDIASVLSETPDARH